MIPRRRTRKAEKQGDLFMPEMVVFRLDPDQLRLLTTLAAEQNLGINELARTWVLEQLAQSGESDGGPDAMEWVVLYLMELRKDLALGFETLLAASGKTTPAEARAWANRNFRCELQFERRQSSEAEPR